MGHLHHLYLKVLNIPVFSIYLKYVFYISAEELPQ